MMLLTKVYRRVLLFVYQWLPIIFGCHCKDERSFYYHRRKFPICARCTGELLGIVCSCICFCFFQLSVIVNIILLIPLIVDGFIQFKTSYESNNIKRLITGCLFGYGFFNLLLLSFVFIVNLGMKFGRYIIQ